MTNIRIEIDGLDALRSHFRDMSDDFDIAVSDAIAETALELERDVKLAIQRGPATGRVYEKYSPRRTHQASAPGQAPATDTGNLIGSIYADIAKMSATVGSRLAYSHYLEFGTRRMAARPVWMPKAKLAGTKFRKRVEANVKAVMQ